MIAGLRGRLATKGRDHVVIDCAGVYYQVFVPGSTLGELGDEDTEAMLYTHLYVREDQMALYGCSTKRQLDMFHTLLNVTGVGPRVALAILGTLPTDTLENAIAQGDVTLLTRVPGVGKKLAQRLVLELKGKLDLTTIGAGQPGGVPLAGPLSEVADALGALGYSPAEINAALQKLPKDGSAPVEEMVLTALQQLGR